MRYNPACSKCPVRSNASSPEEQCAFCDQDNAKILKGARGRNDITIDPYFDPLVINCNMIVVVHNILVLRGVEHGDKGFLGGDVQPVLIAEVFKQGSSKLKVFDTVCRNGSIICIEQDGNCDTHEMAETWV